MKGASTGQAVRCQVSDGWVQLWARQPLGPGCSCPEMKQAWAPAGPLPPRGLRCPCSSGCGHRPSRAQPSCPVLTVPLPGLSAFLSVCPSGAGVTPPPQQGQVLVSPATRLQGTHQADGGPLAGTPPALPGLPGGLAAAAGGDWPGRGRGGCLRLGKAHPPLLAPCPSQ